MLVIGSQYLLALNDGRELPKSTFSSSGGDLAYRYIEAGLTKTLSTLTHKVKSASVRLFGENLEAPVANGQLNFSRDGADDRLRCSSNIAGPSLLSALNGRAVAVGDTFVVSADNVTPSGTYVDADTTYSRKVKALLAKKIASSVAPTVGAVTNTAFNGATLSTSNSVISSQAATAAYSIAATPTIGAGAVNTIFKAGGRFNGKVGEEVTLICTASSSQGVATFTASYKTLGTSETITTTASGSNFQATLPGLGGVVIVLGHAGLAVVGDLIRVVVFPVYDTFSPASVFTVSNQTAYTGTSDTVYIVEVVTGARNLGTSQMQEAVTLRVYDTNGTEPVQNYSVTSSGTVVALGTRGLNMTFITTVGGFSGLVSGDKFAIPVTAASTSATEFDGVILDGPAMNAGAYDLTTGRLSVSIRQNFTGEITVDNAGGAAPFSVSDDKITYVPGLGVRVGFSTPSLIPFVTGRGTLTLAFKAAVKPGAIEGPVKISSKASVASGALGELNVENDLAYGAYQAAGALGGRTPIHVLRTSEDTVEAFAAALKKVRGVDIHYALNPLTSKPEVISLVAAHCEEMSDPDHMNFRRAYFGTDSPGEYTLWDKKSDGNYRKATLVGDLVTIDAADTSVSNFTSTLYPIYAGDRIRFLALPGDLTIAEVLSATTVRVTGAPANGVPVASSFKLIKPDTPDNTIDYVIARSLSVSNRRATNVWCDRPTAVINGEEIVVSSQYLASEIAGLRCALRPQQGLTMTEVTGIDSAPAMYGRFTPEQLDRCAAAGVLIVTQDIEGGEIYIRHQLTTETDNGALQYEDNIGVVVDTFCYRQKDKFRSYLGKKNATAATVTEIYADLKQLAIEASQKEVTDDDTVGPLIQGFTDEQGNEGEVTVEIDGDLADKIRTFVNLRVGVSLNGLTQYVDATASVTI